MKTLYVNLAERRYPIKVGPGLIPEAGSRLAGIGFDSPPIVISNPTILQLHGQALMKSLEREFGRTPVLCIGDGERFKNHQTLLKIYEGMFRAHADRRSWILAFGGGIIGDIAGFAAATFMRGIRFVMVPTTLLAQVDSSIGGKVGLNMAQGKNLIGAFHQPAAVLSDTKVLKTLPKRELASGLYEVIKCGAIRSEPLLRYLEQRLAGALSCRNPEMEHIVVASAKIKAAVVKADEKESGLRMILNYGHTVGHAFEAATDYKRFNHGEAVAWGMIAASGCAVELGMMQSSASARLAGLIHRVGPLPSLDGISPAQLWNALVRDKKFRSGDIRMVFLKRLGNAQVYAGIDPSSLRKFLKRFLKAKGSIV
jgi:3-dehydroquinate synthase